MRFDLLYVISTISWGGLEMNVLKLIRKMLEKGYSLTVACNPKGRFYHEINKTLSESWKQIDIIGLGDGFFENLKIFLNVLRKKNFDIIHIFRSSDVKLISLALSLFRGEAKMVFDPQIGIGVKKKDLFHRFIYKRIKTVIAPSEDVASGILKNLPIGKDKLKIIHPGIDVEKFSFKEDVRERVRKEFGFNDDEIVIGVVSRFSPGKGHEELFKAFKILAGEFENVRLLIIGEPTVGELDYFKKLRKLQDELGIGDKTIWAGFRRDVYDVLCGIDIFVAPSHAEAFGLSLVEAMSTQLPVVATRNAGFLDIISDGENGLFFEKGDYNDLAEKIKLLMENKELAKRLGKKARETVCEKFSFERYIGEIESLYFELKQTEVKNVQHSKS
ncbi:glycosyltransferase family 4 protein [Candidatus Kryptobacter tengchongensis]|uniref:glycosyltransferase family 4 protein n=1 Tax=Kryptobacter tengchongensis TaxID=1643429 RepID=UPI000707BDE5|nr:glycosyltransferase family 4 protein [Candidatus Kryptobacter tengchongensis]CUS80980.1 Glycosyltransferase involved in cell wall bisynthesis [Candidatus Kryptobacter tengchongensis]